MAMVWAVDGAILGAPIGGPEIERQADIAAVESNRPVKADVQKKGGAISGGSILGAPIGVPKNRTPGRQQGGGAEPGRRGGCAEKGWC